MVSGSINIKNSPKFPEESDEGAQQDKKYRFNTL